MSEGWKAMAENVLTAILIVGAPYVLISGGLFGKKKYRVYGDDVVTQVSHGWFWNELNYYNTSTETYTRFRVIRPLYVKSVTGKRPAVDYD